MSSAHLLVSSQESAVSNFSCHLVYNPPVGLFLCGSWWIGVLDQKPLLGQSGPGVRWGKYLLKDGRKCVRQGGAALHVQLDDIFLFVKRGVPSRASHLLPDTRSVISHPHHWSLPLFPHLSPLPPASLFSASLRENAATSTPESDSATDPWAVPDGAYQDINEEQLSLSRGCTRVSPAELLAFEEVWKIFSASSHGSWRPSAVSSDPVD